MSQNPALPPSATEAEILFELELNVARKADEIARSRRFRTGLNLHCWLLAEREVFGTLIAEEAAQAREPGFGVARRGRSLFKAPAEMPALVTADH
ncbi:MAG TPA: hypothetical protein VG838_12670 [Opitutaceae bacterium]|nr:hypothetical protein [Opitutaceae bacterium]